MMKDLETTIFVIKMKHFVFLFCIILLLLSRYLFGTIISNFLNISENINIIIDISSILVTIFIWYVWFKFNKNLDIQNKMSFEEFRPSLKPIKWLKIENIWNFEATDIQCYYIKLDEDLQLHSIEKYKLQSSTLWCWISMNLSELYNWYYSVILLYKNYSSWVYYITWFNYFDWDNIFSIWVDYIQNAITKHYQSPIKRDDYLNMLNKITLKEQIISNVDVIQEFNKFINLYAR